MWRLGWGFGVQRSYFDFLILMVYTSFCTGYILTPRQLHSHPNSPPPSSGGGGNLFALTLCSYSLTCSRQVESYSKRHRVLLFVKLSGSLLALWTYVALNKKGLPGHEWLEQFHGKVLQWRSRARQDQGWLPYQTVLLKSAVQDGNSYIHNPKCSESWTLACFFSNF